MAAFDGNTVTMKFEIEPELVEKVKEAEERLFAAEREARSARNDLMEALGAIQYSYQMVRVNPKEDPTDG